VQEHLRSQTGTYWELRKELDQGTGAGNKIERNTKQEGK
jgi:hypothetical protein